MRRLRRRDFVRLTAAGVAGIAAGHSGGSFAMQENRGGQRAGRGSGGRPNIVFLFTDDQRFDTVRALGNEDIVTPTLDGLVQDGVAFTRAHIMGGTIPAVCAPSRAMALSGRTLFRAPISMADTISFPEVLQQAGYRTFCTGKWHNGAPAFARGFGDGAKIFFGGMSDHLKVPVHDYDADGRYSKENRYTGDKFSSELFTDAAVNFIQAYQEDDPFLVYLPYTAPHDPRMAPKKFEEMYDPGKIPVPENFMPEHPFDNGELRIRDEKLAPWPRTPEIAQEHIAAYYAMITHVDEQMGRVVQTLEETGHADNTIVIFSGDNGLAVGQHGLLGKQNVYDHSVRVPLIITGPGIPRGEQRDAMCYLFDLFPTMCELADLPIPDSVEGQSLAPVIRGERPSVRDTMFFAYKDVQRAARDERYKLIEYFVGDARTTQLFDLVDDPWEVNNLADDPNCAEHVTRLRGELARQQKALGDPLA